MQDKFNFLRCLLISTLIIIFVSACRSKTNEELSFNKEKIEKKI